MKKPDRPEIVGQRLRSLREGIHLSQAKHAEKMGNIDQPAIFRYENACSFPPYSALMLYADFFDVSLDYIFGRTDNPQGKLYNYQPQFMKNGEEIQELIEMCFDPKSPANAKLKQALLELLQENQK